ncbi:hypothetical protein LHU53_14565 [Rhodoferax sp. U2-2l]|uniref:hypothetical protein n=1 Tax=Rhodoferax sp. U2-2l TaxID=2884000 RepID=UPI001D0B1F5E|nr:hypothetical protein [Rhodoferax sp. U2-2l]MCB8748126.1 hypothetical protein [Rhodoferax sp. U2-2l]
MRQTLRNIRLDLPTPKAFERLKTAQVDDDKVFAQAKQAAAQDKVLARGGCQRRRQNRHQPEETPA